MNALSLATSASIPDAIPFPAGGERSAPAAPASQFLEALNALWPGAPQPQPQAPAGQPVQTDKVAGLPATPATANTNGTASVCDWMTATASTITTPHAPASPSEWMTARAPAATPKEAANVSEGTGNTADALPAPADAPATIRPATPSIANTPAIMRPETAPTADPLAIEAKKAQSAQAMYASTIGTAAGASLEQKSPDSEALKEAPLSADPRASETPQPKAAKESKSEEHEEHDNTDKIALSPDASAAAAASVIVLNSTPAAQTNDNPPPRAAHPETATATDPVQNINATATLAVSPVAGNLAFALRIQSPKSNQDAHANDEAAPTTTTVSRTSNASEGTPATPAPALPPQKLERQIQSIVAPAAVHEHTSSPAQQNAPVNEATRHAPASDFEAELNKFRAAEPVRGAHVQISGAYSDQRVDIRLVERGGALSVSVRSADPALTRVLQEHAPELNTKLNLEHFRTELWAPPSTPSPARGSFEQHANQQQAGSWSNPSGNANSQQQNRRKQQQPEWIDEMEQHSAALQKRINYTWQ